MKQHEPSDGLTRTQSKPKSKGGNGCKWVIGIIAFLAIAGIIVLVVLLLTKGKEPEPDPPVPPEPEPFDNIQTIVPFTINDAGTAATPASA